MYIYKVDVTLHYYKKHKHYCIHKTKKKHRTKITQNYIYYSVARVHRNYFLTLFIQMIFIIHFSYTLYDLCYLLLFCSKNQLYWLMALGKKHTQQKKALLIVLFTNSIFGVFFTRLADFLLFLCCFFFLMVDFFFLRNIYIIIRYPIYI